MDISEGIDGNLNIKILTTNTVDLTLLTEERFKGKVLQPGADAVRTKGEHGLAMIFEVKNDEKTHIYLLDAGNVTGTILENSKAFKINLKDTEKLVLSHGHFDHFGALMKIIPELKEGCEIILNPQCYYQSHSILFAKGKKVSVEQLGTSLKELIKEGTIKKHRKLPPLNQSLLNKVATENHIKIVETSKPYKFQNGITTSGEITLFNRDEVTRGMYVSKSKTEFENYLARDETSIYINIKDKGLVILTGCGHAGIVNTIKHAQELTGIKEVYAIIGGFHKVNQPNETIEDTIKFIEDLNPEITCGMHCTGFEFNKRMSVKGHPSHTLGVTGTEFHL
ncbi:MAG: MBL fold metallo-hydrolase [Promethearchaeota archaeon]|jgi:7,8-dihydropterin-6-yl-methyl-4-(beta-D-ribofuranosyl)aminobenzene 5'-phosphate synthase